jgi:hypothetical protein
MDTRAGGSCSAAQMGAASQVRALSARQPGAFTPYGVAERPDKLQNYYCGPVDRALLKRYDLERRALQAPTYP